MRLFAKIWWAPLIIYLIITPAFMSARIEKVPCRKIEITISDSAKYHFVTPAGIFNIAQNEKRSLLGNELGKIEIEAIEKDISRIRELESTEVYNTIDGVLHIEADQRDPVVRLITQYGNSYYIDKQGVIVPHSKMFTPRVAIVSGYLNIPTENLSRGEINTLDEGSMVKKVISFVNFINEDKFWSGQIEQIWVNQSGELEIVPRVGNHIIKFGPPDNFEEKLLYLETFYLKTLPEMGWNSYKEINLRYEGQIVCKRR